MRRDVADQNSPVRLSLTLPGSASLGAFQAGALSALAVVVTSLRARGRPVRVDAIGGASAGSIVAMLWAHCLLTGRDTTAFLRNAWVDEVDAELLRCGGRGSPLAFDDLRERIIDFVDDVDEHPFDAHRPLDEPMVLQVSLTSLLGLTTPVEIASGRSELITYADHVEQRLEPEHEVSSLFEPDGTSLLDAVLASASHPGAFPPRTLDRTGHREHYDELGVETMPDDLALWYTDGGLVESRPVGRILDAARSVGGSSDGGPRLHLVVDPRSSGPSGSESWADSSSSHTWLDGIRRALSILPTQALHDDLRDIAERNSRIGVVDQLVDELVEEGAIADDSDVSDVRERIAWAADVAGQEPVDVDIISPLLLAEDDDTAGDDEGVTDLLAGDFIGAFGGFLSREVRRNDFALGWASTERWADGGLLDHGVDEHTSDEVMSALADARPDDWASARRTGDGVDQLDWTGRWQLALLALQTGRVLADEALPSPIDSIRQRVGS